jgi:hypothetical protein
MPVSLFLAKFPLQPAIFIVWPIAMIIWQAGSAIDSCQSARAKRQAHFDPDELIQQPWALAVQEAPVVNGECYARPEG